MPSEEIYSFLKDENNLYTCKITGRSYKVFSEFIKHLKKNRITLYNYIIKFDLDDKSNYLQCMHCGDYCIYLKNHLKSHKDITPEKYIEMYKPIIFIGKKVTEVFSEKKIGELNPLHKSKLTEQERKEMSPYSREFYKKHFPNFSEDEIEFMFKYKIDDWSSNRLYNTQLEYWMLKTNGNLEEAKKMLYKRQSTYKKIK